MRRIILIGLAVVLLVTLVLLTNRSNPLANPPDSTPSGKQTETSSARSTSTFAPTSSSPSFDELTTSQRRNALVGQIADRPRFVSTAPAAQRVSGGNDIALQNAQQGLRDYRIAFHENPVGTNAQITKKLLGNNSRGTRFLPASAHMNSKNELTDRWDEPIFFHQISATKMEVRSAGPDHIMWNNDDDILP